MHKRLLCVAALITVLLTLCAFTPLGGTWLDVTTTELGPVRIYFNSTYDTDYFTLDESDKPVLIWNNTILGYVLNSNGVRIYTITIGAYGDSWYYRDYNQTSTYNRVLHINSVDFDTSTVNFMGLDSTDAPYNVYYIMLFFAAAILLGVWRCARK